MKSQLQLVTQNQSRENERANRKSKRIHHAAIHMRYRPLLFAQGTHYQWSNRRANYVHIGRPNIYLLISIAPTNRSRRRFALLKNET